MPSEAGECGCRDDTRISQVRNIFEGLEADVAKRLDDRNRMQDGILGAVRLEQTTEERVEREEAREAKSCAGR